MKVWKGKCVSGVGKAGVIFVGGGRGGLQLVTAATTRSKRAIRLRGGWSREGWNMGGLLTGPSPGPLGLSAEAGQRRANNTLDPLGKLHITITNLPITSSYSNPSLLHLTQIMLSQVFNICRKAKRRNTWTRYQAPNLLLPITIFLGFCVIVYFLLFFSGDHSENGTPVVRSSNVF